MARIYNHKETDVTMVPRNDRGEYVKVCRLTPEGNQLSSVDIRNYYTSENDGKIYPTQKGVRIHSEMLVDTVVAILNTLTDDEFVEVFSKTRQEVEHGD